ncbi:MAG: flagellar hook-basal body complex protein FliE [Euryarchaeota archaeon]|nr:flagellar hook-basal body complex protein FliE [Euryarchaeota archaeon]
MHAILVIGMPGAGKEEFVRVASETGYKVVRMGDTVRAYAQRAGLKTDDASIGKFASVERERHGKDVWAKRTLEGVEGKCVIDGVRSMAEVEAYSKALGDKAILLALVAGSGIRFGRLRARGRSDAPKTYEEFKSRDERELGWGLGDAIGHADYYLTNEGGLRAFRRSAKALIENIETE